MFSEGDQQKTSMDGLLQGLSWRASSRRPGVAGSLLVSRSIFGRFLFVFSREFGQESIIEYGLLQRLGWRE